MDFKKIVIGFIVLLVVIWIYRYFFTDPTSSTLLDYGDGKDSVVINSTKLSGNSAATDFTYSFWMYVNNWNYKLGKKKTIIRRQGNGGGLSPEIYLDNYSNDLVVNLEIYKNGEIGDSGISEIAVLRLVPVYMYMYSLLGYRYLGTVIAGQKSMGGGRIPGGI